MPTALADNQIDSTDAMALEAGVSPQQLVPGITRQRRAKEPRPAVGCGRWTPLFPGTVWNDGRTDRGRNCPLDHALHEKPTPVRHRQGGIRSGFSKPPRTMAAGFVDPAKKRGSPGDINMAQNGVRSFFRHPTETTISHHTFFRPAKAT